MLPKISALFRMIKDPELRFTPSGLEVCSLYMAASEKYKDKETQLFIAATAFGKTGEFIATIKKGQRVYCTGKLQTETWEKDGQRHSKITMIIDSFEYIEKRDDSKSDAQRQAEGASQKSTHQGYQSQQPAQQNNASQAPQMPDTDKFDEFDDGTPF